MNATLISAATFMGVCSAHSVFSRLNRSCNRVASFFSIGLVGAILMIAALWFLVGARIEILSVLLVYSLLCELYVFLFTLTIGSVSANLLLALQRQSLAPAEIEKLYDSREMVAKRLARLEAVGLLSRSGDEIRMTPAGIKMQVRWSAFRRFFRHATSAERPT